MSNLIILIFILSIEASIMFGITLLIEHVFQTRHTEYVYIMMKIVLIFYSVPTFIIIQRIIEKSIKYVVSPMQGEDLLNVIQVHKYNIGMLSGIEGIITVSLSVWGLGVIISYINSFIKGKKLLRELIHRSEKVNINEVYDIREQLRKELSVRIKPELYYSSIVGTPFLTGIITPKIIFPSRQFSEEEWRLMLRHELMHLKANDLLFKAIIGVIQNFHWFNPVIYFFKKEFYNFSEYACDKRTINSYDTEQRSQYAKLIVSLAASQPEYGQVVAFANKDYKVIERRVKEIMRKSEKKKSALLIGTMATFMVSCPMVTYATAFGTMDIQDKLVRNELNKYVAEEEFVESGTTVIRRENDTNALMLNTLNLRGINNVDINVPANGVSYFNTLTLKKGDEITISLASDKSTDSFSVSVVDSAGKGKRYSSNKGAVSGTFTVTSNGDYKIYIDNNGDSKIHVTGMIRIE